MNYKGLIQRVMLLIYAPGKAWSEIESEDKQNVASGFVYPMIGLCGLAVFLGVLLQGGDGENGNIVFQRAMTECCKTFVALFGGYFMAAYSINKLAIRFFKKPNDLMLMQQFAGYALVVTFLLDIITGILPDLRILAWIFQFYIIYVVWEGTRELLHVEEKFQMSYTLTASAVLLFCPFFLGAVFNLLTTILN